MLYPKPCYNKPCYKQVVVYMLNLVAVAKPPPNKLIKILGKAWLVGFTVMLSQSVFQWKGENDCRKYFVINLHERMLPDPAGKYGSITCTKQRDT